MLGLVLVGGLSQRMGQPKGLLELDGIPLYRRAYDLLCKVCSEVYLSAQDGQKFDLPTIYDDAFKSIGPASGLLSAYEVYRDTWFVLACDFPLATEDAISRLTNSYRPPATYFISRGGQIEPLFAIWSSEALDKLRENVSKGKTGPVYTLKSLGTGIEPEDEKWLYNANTPEEWQAILK